MDNINIDVNKEIEFFTGIKLLIDKYGENFFRWYWYPTPIIDGFPANNDVIIRKLNKPEYSEYIKSFIYDIENLRDKLKNPKKYNYEDVIKFNKEIIKTIKKYNFKFDKNLNEKDLMKQKYALLRYEIIDALSNISLSVSPKLKKEWNINFELFGSFYNTNSDYCGLFSDLENSKCDFYSFKPKSGMIILINPPYTSSWIKITGDYINEYLKTPNIKIYYIVPVWNTSDRKKLKLKTFKDIPILDELKRNKYLISHQITKLEFYNGISRTNSILNDPVHIYIFSN